MKKTLFAMAALALCGTAVAGDIYLQGKGPQNYVGVYEDGFTVHVNATVTISNVEVITDGAATFKFYGTNKLITADGIFLYAADSSFNIIGDEAAINHWVSELTSATGELKSVTLMSFNEDEGDVYTDADQDFTFDGNVGGETITLGNVSVQYIGYGPAPSFDLFDSVLGENQIALAMNGNSLALVGKITGSPATPEPATATLSLLALAGLASRRRRH